MSPLTALYLFSVLALAKCASDSALFSNEAKEADTHLDSVLSKFDKSVMDVVGDFPQDNEVVQGCVNSIPQSYREDLANEVVAAKDKVRNTDKSYQAVTIVCTSLRTTTPGCDEQKQKYRDTFNTIVSDTYKLGDSSVESVKQYFKTCITLNTSH